MFGGGGSKSLDDELFNLKFTSKQLLRNEKKCIKNQKAQLKKVKQAIEKGNHEGARIYAQVRRISYLLVNNNACFRTPFVRKTKD